VPPPTNMTTILNMKIGLDDKAIDVLMVDYPGENFRNELRKLKREQIKDLMNITPNQTRFSFYSIPTVMFAR